MAEPWSPLTVESGETPWRPQPEDLTIGYNRITEMITVSWMEQDAPGIGRVEIAFQGDRCRTTIAAVLDAVAETRSKFFLNVREDEDDPSTVVIEAP